MDVENSGPEAVFKYILNESEGPESRAEIMSGITQQYISFRHFAEKLNSMIYHLNKLITLNNLPEMLGYLSKSMRKTLNCENVHLWLEDCMTGMFFSYNGEKKTALRALSNKGYLGKLASQHLNSKLKNHIFFLLFYIYN